MHSVGWKKGILWSFILALLSGNVLRAQEIAAEGEYDVGVGAPQAKAATRWVLYSKASGGYHLESDIQSLSDGKRLVQVEELDDYLAPKAIGYEIYLKDQKRPIAAAKCEFAGDTITCSGQSQESGSAACKPYKHAGPFWLWVEGLFALDLPWLLDGALNMAHLETGETSVATITTSGGGANQECYFSPDEEQKLKTIGSDSVEIDGIKVKARHYTLGSGEDAKNLWIAGQGVLIKMDDFVLSHYKQYKMLIPEVSVSTRNGGS